MHLLFRARLVAVSRLTDSVERNVYHRGRALVRTRSILDFNAAGEVVGIEVLDVKRRVPSADLKELKFEVACAGHG